jgi:hypothetical protein
MKFRRLVGFALAASMLATFAKADPWLAPGNEGLRSDIELLADAGILRGPVTTWPMSWPDIARDTLSASDSDFDPATAAALGRVRRLAAAAAAGSPSGVGMEASAANDPSPFRGFADSPRSKGELHLGTSWLGERFAMSLQGTAVVDSDDRQRFRADGSYLGMSVGNFMVSAGFMERWWGPGWDGSLVLSTNARPIPSITLERNYTDRSTWPLFKWIGPWRASIALGETEGHDVAVPNVRLLAARVNFKPRPWLEFGLTRTAQWCGEGRPCDAQTFRHLLLGQDNVEQGGARDDEPGNQMAGYDMRMRSPWRAVPVVFYSQWIGEDEAGGLPSKFLGQFGLETWFSTGFGNVRLRAEYADTACSFSRQNPEFDCAYRNSLYPQGYTFRHRVIGHTMDNDSRMATLAAVINRPNGDTLSVAFRRINLNRDGSADHAISQVPIDFDNVELRYSLIHGPGSWSAGISYDSHGIAEDSDSRMHAFLRWQQGL